MSRHWLYHGQVSHARLGEQRNAFGYPALFLCFPLSARASLSSRLFSLTRWNLFGWRAEDHGDGGDPERWIRDILSREGLEGIDGEVWLQTQPRILGFVFNPVSFWYCHDRTGALRAVLCEVRNTFGERHCYLLTAPGQDVIGEDTPLTSRKVFHVSPFYPVDGEYHFQFTLRDDERRVRIDYWRNGEPALRTQLAGRAVALGDRQLLRSFLRFGWATVLVVWRIHRQALRLWLMGVTFHSKPAPPGVEITR